MTKISPPQKKQKTKKTQKAKKSRRYWNQHETIKQTTHKNYSRPLETPPVPSAIHRNRVHSEKTLKDAQKGI